MPGRLKLSLRFPIAEVEAFADRYSYADDSIVLEKIGPAAKEQRYLTRQQLLELAHWKSPRIVPKCGKNDAEFVEEVTGKALQSKHERFRVEALRMLNGVDWPMASVILHFCHGDRYPILDYRALWSLRVHPVPRYSYALWEEYTKVTRELAAEAGVSMRVLDRALWQYSKENQPKAGS
jgi:hypothetical protein